MTNHYFDENGVYTASAPANPGSLPPLNALRTAPPEREGFCPVLNASRDGWELEEDHRGREGYVDGVHIKLERPGPLPPGWSDAPEPAEETRDTDELRAAAFAAEADPLLDRALAYRAEAEAWRLLNNAPNAEKAENKSRAALREYLNAKEAVRARHPDAEERDAAPPPEPAQAEQDAPAERRYWLKPSGMYHAEGCRYASGAGGWVAESALSSSARRPKPCRQCRPEGAEG